MPALRSTLGWVSCFLILTATCSQVSGDFVGASVDFHPYDEGPRQDQRFLPAQRDLGLCADLGEEGDARRPSPPAAEPRLERGRQ